jgi:hydrogenase nickel incorporation protein HypA/HybF
VHELSLAQNVIDIAETHAEGRKIREIILVMGELAGVAEASIRFCFQVVSQSTAAEGALLSVRTLPALIRCVHCGFTFGTGGEGNCPRCGQYGGDVVSGREFYVESIEVED